MSDSKWLAIVNPNAGKCLAAKMWPSISNILKKYKVDFDEAFTTHRFHAVELVLTALKSGFRNFISVGGDGTLHEIVNGVYHQTEVPVKDVTIAVIPVGSGNDWARLYGVPFDYEEAVKVLIKGKTFLQDVGKITYTETGVTNMRYMVNIVGVGFDANICYYTALYKSKGKYGMSSYVRAAFKALIGRKFNRTEVKADGKVFCSSKVFSIAFGVGKYSGGGMMQLPDAIPDDGLINTMVARKLPKVKFLFNIKNLFAGKLYKIREVSHTMAKKYEVTTATPDRIEIDGEVVGTTPMTIEVIPRALRMVVGDFNFK